MGSEDRGADEVALVRDDEELVLGPIDPDSCQLSAVDDLARLRLAASRGGWRVEVRRPGGDFAALLDLCGLADLFGD
jgi:hypothetical protein